MWYNPCGIDSICIIIEDASRGEERGPHIPGNFIFFQKDMWFLVTTGHFSFLFQVNIDIQVTTVITLTTFDVTTYFDHLRCQVYDVVWVMSRCWDFRPSSLARPLWSLWIGRRQSCLCVVRGVAVSPYWWLVPVIFINFPVVSRPCHPQRCVDPLSPGSRYWLHLSSCGS